MTRIQKSALKAHLRSNLKFHKKELRKLVSVGSRLHMRSDRLFKVAFGNIKKEIRLFQRLNSKIRIGEAGSSCLSPPTPPDMRVRIRRFRKLLLNSQTGNTQLRKILVRQCAI